MRIVHRRQALAAVLAFTLSGCSGAAPAAESSDQPPAAPAAETRKVAVDESFTLAPGESVEFGDSGVTLRFKSVLADSRCPAKVTCVWAGNAEVELEIRHGESTVTAVLNTNVGSKQAGIPGDPPHNVTLVELAPYPQESGKINQEQYRATLKVEREYGGNLR